MHRPAPKALKGWTRTCWTFVRGGPRGRCRTDDRSRAALPRHVERALHQRPSLREVRLEARRATTRSSASRRSAASPGAASSPVSLVRHELGDAREPRGHHRHAGRERLHQDHRQTLHLTVARHDARQHEQVGALEQRSARRPRARCPRKRTRCAEAEPPDPAPRGRRGAGPHPTSSSSTRSSARAPASASSRTACPLYSWRLATQSARTGPSRGTARGLNVYADRSMPAWITWMRSGSAVARQEAAVELGDRHREARVRQLARSACSGRRRCRARAR